MHTEEELPTQTPSKSPDSATSSGRVLFVCPLLDAPRRVASPGPSPVDDAKSAAQSTSPVIAAETPTAQPTPSVPETPLVPPAPQFAPEPARRTESPPAVRGRSRVAMLAIALAAVAAGAAIPLWPQSEDEPPSSRPAPAPAPSSPASADLATPAAAAKDDAQPRAPRPPAGSAKDVHVADKAAATPPAPVPAARKNAFVPRLPQPEMVGAPRDVDGVERKSVDSDAAQRFDLTGLPAHENSVGAKEIRRLVAQFHEGDLAAAAEIQRKLAQYYTRFADPVRANAARDRATVLERAIADAARAGSAPGVPAPGFGGGSPR